MDKRAALISTFIAFIGVTMFEAPIFSPDLHQMGWIARLIGATAMIVLWLSTYRLFKD